MVNLNLTNNLKIKTTGLYEEHKSKSCCTASEEKLNELDKKTRESFSRVMLSSYKDLGHYGMTVAESKPMSENFNKKLEMKVKESQDVFSKITIADYEDLGRYNL